MEENSQTTRSIYLSTSLHFDSLLDFREAGAGQPKLRGQTAVGIDNGYGLQGNPTLHALQDSISRLEKGTYSLLFPSGLTALIALGAFLKSGDHWLIPDSVYAPLQRYAKYLQERYGIIYSLYNPGDLKTLSKAIKKETKLIHIESPSSVTFDITDIDEVVKIAKSKDILTSADNTWASGVLCQPLDHGVDISILSLTKYPAGYSDVFMGSITTRNQSLFGLLSYYHRVFGYTVSPFSAMLVTRGLETLMVRLAAHETSATKLVEAFELSKKILRINYIDSSKIKTFSGSNGLFSIELDRLYTNIELEKLLSVFSTFKIGESWGGTRSLVLPFQPDELSNRLNPPINTIVRFHSGLEDIVLQTQDVVAFIEALDLTP
ncbi:MAG TPA: PLP-dependent aspartate aminotransferase family protein [Patescibacteria group bacterium]|jgi:cystathionine beta-lyase|nr:PLP-dependent aspartate aminotransferase family protein [Patescibacteria group bacterium]